MENNNLLIELLRSATAVTVGALGTGSSPCSPVGGAVKAATEFLESMYLAYAPGTALPPTQDNRPPAGLYKETEMERGDPGMLFIPNEALGIPDLGPASWKERPFCAVCRRPIYGGVSYTSKDSVEAYSVHAACMSDHIEGKDIPVESERGES